jgi:hypothetical protein
MGSNVGSLLQIRGNWLSAIEPYSELGLCMAMLGKEHPSTQTSINNLTAVLSGQGKYG